MRLPWVTGFADMPDGRSIAFRYSDGVGMESLGSLFGESSVGRGINNLGWVTGNSDGWNIFLHRDDDGMTLLGQGVGWSINDCGVVVGETSLTGSGGEAFAYRAGNLQVLCSTCDSRKGANECYPVPRNGNENEPF
jgi:hypothetical protein